MEKHRKFLKRAQGPRDKLLPALRGPWFSTGREGAGHHRSPSQDLADLFYSSPPQASSSAPHRGRPGERQGATLWPGPFCGYKEGSGRRLEVLRKMKFGDD